MYESFSSLILPRSCLRPWLLVPCSLVDLVGDLFQKLLTFLGTLSTGIRGLQWIKVHSGRTCISIKHLRPPHSGAIYILGWRFLMSKPTWGPAQFSRRTESVARFSFPLGCQESRFIIHSQRVLPLGAPAFWRALLPGPLCTGIGLSAPGTKDPKNQC